MRRLTTGFSEDGRWFYSSAPEPLAVPFLYDLKAEAEAKILGKEAFERALREHPEHSKALSQHPLVIEGVSEDGQAVDLRAGKLRLRWDAKAARLEDRLPSAARLKPTTLSGRSKSGGDSTTITLRNDLGQVIRIFWADPDGSMKAYGELKPGETREQHTFEGHVWLADFSANDLAGVFVAKREGGTAVFDKDSRRIAMTPAQTPRETERKHQFVHKDHNLLLKSGSGEHLLTSDGSDSISYEKPMWVTDDQRYAVGWRAERAARRSIQLIESSPKDDIHGRLHTLTYNKPGDPIDQRRPVIYDLIQRKQIPLDAKAFENSWSVGQGKLLRDGRTFACIYNRRGHQQVSLYGIDLPTGRIRTIAEEKSKTFVDYSQKLWHEWVEDRDEVLWMSERSGFNHLYLINTKTGSAKAITEGPFMVRSVESVDQKARTVTLTVLGIHPDQDPYHSHAMRVNFDGSNPVVLTQSDGDHEIEWSKDRKWFVATWSRADHPHVFEFRRARDGALIKELGRGDDSQLIAQGFVHAERFVAPGRDGMTKIYGQILRPSGWKKDQRYPVIEAIYAGPHGFHVGKSFNVQSRLRTLTELGFIVVRIDGMGTNWRGKAFHDVCYQNLKDGGFPDRIAWMRAAAATRSEMDLSRVGIFGGSAGGQNALAALLHHGDFYHAAASDCGCHDNRVDKIWWNEAWMGWPIGPHYAESSNVTHAHKLKGKLFLTVGELDRNVDPVSTLQVVDALIKADKDFEFYLVPGGGHGVGESPYLQRRRAEFFVRHLKATPSR
jgi:dipeptidyl aminopeptidase/acylaminoacyl peptidase